jgi:hypothetical protein
MDTYLPMGCPTKIDQNSAHKLPAQGFPQRGIVPEDVLGFFPGIVSQKSPHFFHYFPEAVLSGIPRSKVFPILVTRIMGIEEPQHSLRSYILLVCTVVSVKEFEPYSPNFSL